MIPREIGRLFRSQLLFASCGAAVLALGIGTSTLALTFLLAFQSLTYPEIRSFRTATVAEETSGGGSSRITFERFERLRQSSPSVARFAAYSRRLPAPPGDPSAVAVSSGFFSVFTAPLEAGRDFSPVEEGQSGKHVAILSSRFAERQFRSPARALGQHLILRGHPFEVIGVAPRSLEGMFGEWTDVWVPSSAILPLVVDAPASNPELWKTLNIFYALAATESGTMEGLIRHLRASLPPVTEGETRLLVSPGLTDDPLRDQQLRRRLRLGFGLALAFTIVSALNLAWILMSQTPARAAETNLKKALGADTMRLISEAAVGPATLVTLGFGGAGVMLVAGITAIGRLTGLEGQVARAAWRTALMAYGLELPLALVLTAAVVLLPMIGVLRAAGADLRTHSVQHTRPVTVLMTMPVILQVSLAAATCVVAGMLGAALLADINEYRGYDPSSLTVVNIAPSTNRVSVSWSSSEVSPTMRALAALAEEAQTIPGVRAAAYSSGLVGERDVEVPVSIDRSDSKHSSGLKARELTVGSGFFAAVGGKLIAGRDFAKEGGAEEIILNQAAALALWPNDSPLNRSVRITRPAAFGFDASSDSAIVVGVTANMKPPGYGSQPTPAIYTSINRKGFTDLTPKLVLNGTASWSVIEATLNERLRARLPGMKVASVYRVRDRLRAFYASEGTSTYLAVAGACVMTLVSAIGLHASLAYFVRTRRRELAIRACLGATSGSIRRVLYRRALTCAGLGVLLCVPLWPALAGLSSVEYLGPVSWSTGRAVAISAVCLMASIVTAWLAAREAVSVPLAQLLKEE